MKQKTLAEYVDAFGQTETARRAGLSQGAIWQMLKAGRRVFVIEREGDRIELEEIKSIKSTNAA